MPAFAALFRGLPLAALLALAGAARADDGAGNFDTPVASRHVELGDANTGAVQRGEVRCNYYPHFMVKEVDQLEVGATELSILASAPGLVPPCLQANMPGEHVIDGSVWSGYFLGAKGEYAVFSSPDGVNGGMGFAIFRSNDASLRFSGTFKGKLQFTQAGPATMTVRYAKLHSADCSVIAKGNDCIAAIAAATGAPPIPIEACRTGYTDLKRTRAHAWCEAHNRNNAPCIDEQLGKLTALDASPSVIALPVELTLREDEATERPLGPPGACTPAD
jgi:hypothetical protein